MDVGDRQDLNLTFTANYTTGPLTKQYGTVLRKISRYALPRRAEQRAALAHRTRSIAALPVRSEAPETQQPVRLAG